MSTKDAAKKGSPASPGRRTGARSAGRDRGKRASKRLWDRGATEAGLLLVSAAVASGVIFGAGIARGASVTTDGQTWLSDGSTGNVVRINPVTGEPETAVDLGLAGVVSVTQGDGVLVVTDPNGKSVSVNLTTLLAGGKKDTSDAKLLLRNGRTYLATLDPGVIHAVNPVTLDDVGEAYTDGGAEFSDVVVDDQDTVWAVTTSGDLISLRYSVDANRFVKQDSTEVKGAGEGTKLVPHAKGVTVWAPEGGTVIQVGTGKDVEKVVPEVQGNDVMVADESPDNLIAASIPDSGTVIIYNGTSFISSSSSSCPEPGKPSIYEGKVYVPCTGSGRTIVLGPDGRTAGPDIVTEDGKNPIITTDEGKLIVTSEGGEKSTTVPASGPVKKTDLRENPVPKVNADKPPPYYQPPTTTPPPTTTSAPPPGQSQSSAPGPGSQTGGAGGSGGYGSPDTNGNGNGEGGSSSSSSARGSSISQAPSGSTTSSAPKPVDGATGVSAVSTAPGTAQVSWKAPTGKPLSYRIETADGGSATQADGSATSAPVSGLTPGSTVRFVVYANFASGSTKSPTSAPVTIQSAPTTTTSPPPVTTTNPPPTTTTPPVTTTAPLPTTTTDPPPTTTTPPAPTPDPPSNVQGGSGSSLSVTVSWAGPAANLQSGFTVVATADWSGAQETQTIAGTSTSFTFTVAEVGTKCDGGSGIAFSVVANYATGSSTAATGTGYVAGGGPAYQCECGVQPAAAGLGGKPMGPIGPGGAELPPQCPAAGAQPLLAAPDNLGPVTQDTEPRYGVALGLVFLAGGVRLGRWKLDRRNPPGGGQHR